MTQEIEKSVVCYLDFDGVMHHDAVYWHPKKGIYIKTPGHTLFQWMPVLENLLAPRPEIKIVLSTSWVHVKSFSFAKAQLSLPLQSRIVGATFHRREMRKDRFAQMSRAMQILADVDRRQPMNWFAIDNDAEGWPEWCRDKLVKTEDHLGLSAPNVQDSIRDMLKNL